MARLGLVCSVGILSILLCIRIAFSARIVGGDGVVFHFHGSKDKDFCLVSDGNLHINSHMIGNSDAEHPLTWIGALGIMFGHVHLSIEAAPEAAWDPFLDHLVIRVNGHELNIPAPGHKAGPLARAGVWESADDVIRITRGRVNEARIELRGTLDLRVRAETVQPSFWSEDSCFVHLDMEVRQLATSPDVHGVLGQTYRPARVEAAQMRLAQNEGENVSEVDMKVLGKKLPAIVGRTTDYLSSSLWTADCKYSKYFSQNQQTVIPSKGKSASIDTPSLSQESLLNEKPTGGATRGSGSESLRGGATSATLAASGSSARLAMAGEDVNPLQAYFGESAVKVVKRGKMSGEDIDEESSPSAFSIVDRVPVVVEEEGMVVEIDEGEQGALIDGTDMDTPLQGDELEMLMNE
eukprot:TRINITY_DN38515_c0_g1_i1.p1 TRINITY_DN38515_c0_g1~~TRINITY_DN38515_c0_g1_i1.p1  ORF type:complete len:408 (-),score=67.19 TRINITY_DN38515_c0_g1_i1:735-1958(-)